MRALAFAAMTLAAVAFPAFADNGQVFDSRAQAGAFENTSPRNTLQCFDGRRIAAAARAGVGRLVVQTPRGALYSVRLAGDCSALASATAISLRPVVGAAVCDGDAARLVLKTDQGPQRCSAKAVELLSRSEVMKLRSTDN